MKLSKEAAEMIRNAANKPDGTEYYDEIIRQLKSSSKISICSLFIAIFSLIVAIVAIVI